MIIFYELSLELKDCCYFDTLFRKSMSSNASHRKSIAAFNVKDTRRTWDEGEGDETDFPARPKSRSITYQSGTSPKPPTQRSSTSKSKARFQNYIVIIIQIFNTMFTLIKIISLVEKIINL